MLYSPIDMNKSFKIPLKEKDGLRVSYWVKRMRN